MSRRKDTVQKCPKCDGQGLVSKPPWVAGDATTWVSSTVGPYVCNLCDGQMVVIVPGQKESAMMLFCACGCGRLFHRHAGWDGMHGPGLVKTP